MVVMSIVLDFFGTFKNFEYFTTAERICLNILMTSKPRIFLIAGRTGGPFFPLPTVAKNLGDVESVYIGIKGGFEDRIAHEKNLKIEYLPDSRLTILTFKKEKLSETVINYFKLLWNFALLFWSFLKSFYLLLKFKPKLIYSTGSFLAVPIIFACRFSNFLKFTQTKIVVHQQDPEPGLANRLTAPYVDLLSCVFQYTKDNFALFKKAALIPNPIDTELYESEKSVENAELAKFIISKNKPILLVFGGGSGSEDINLWVLKYLDELLLKFKVIHLTGILQKNKLIEIKNPDYLRFEALLKDMPVALKNSDVVICRAGMASITELLFLQKPAYLVPLPATHQEKNAQLVSQYFFVLDQADRPDWINIINQSFPGYFKQITFPSGLKVKAELAKYYNDVKTFANL